MLLSSIPLTFCRVNYIVFMIFSMYLVQRMGKICRASRSEPLETKGKPDCRHLFDSIRLVFGSFSQSWKVRKASMVLVIRSSKDQPSMSAPC